jgi:ABC-2 type transport system permease protein
LAAYTPTAALRSFEQGLLRLNTVLVMLAISVAGFAFAAIWLHTGRTARVRLLSSAALVLVVAAVMFGSNGLRASWDLSENRRNSFSHTDEVALKQIQQPLRIKIFLAPEDPRLTDFEQNILRKLRRTVPHLEVDYSANSRTGLFESGEDHYGEIWYEMSGSKEMERSTIEQVVLEQVYKLAHINPPAGPEEDQFPGYPLAAGSRWSSWIFYLFWPLATIVAWWLVRR